jgi:NADH-quinone oxidoreductase subunit J
MSWAALLFWILAALALASAAAMILQVRNTIYAALSLVITMIALGGLFLLLDAHFVGLVQWMVYAGAIVAVFVFVVMLLNLRATSMGADLQPFAKLLGTALVAGFAIKGAGMLWAVQGSWSRLPPGHGTVRSLGQLLYTDYLLVVQLAGVLLLAGIVAAVVVGKRSLD